jgi:hypothetical protein
MGANDYDLGSLNSPLKMNDGDYNTFFRSNVVERINAKGELGPEKIVLLWDEPISFNKLVLAVNNAQQQGLKLFNVQVCRDTFWNEWTELPKSKLVNWATSSTQFIEKKTVGGIYEKTENDEIVSDISNVTGICLLIWCANLSEKRYALSEFEVYNNVQADTPVGIKVQDAPKQLPNLGGIGWIVLAVVIIITMLLIAFLLLKKHRFTK